MSRMDFATSYSFCQVNRDIKASRSDVFVSRTKNAVSKHYTASCVLSCLLYFGNTKNIFDDNFCQNMGSDSAWFCKSSCGRRAIKFKRQSRVSHENVKQV